MRPVLFGWVALFIGAYEISPLRVLSLISDALFSPSGMDSSEAAILFDIRLPRVILAGLVGVALASSGVTLQGLFRNPLVDPFILGVSAGAAFGCSLSIGLLPYLPVQLMAFVFGILSVFLTYTVAKTQGVVSRLPLILSGVIISAFFTALVSIVKFLVDPHKLQSIVFWLMGSFSLADWPQVALALPGIAISLIPVFLMRWRLNVISMGEDEARLLGVNVKRTVSS